MRISLRLLLWIPLLTACAAAIPDDDADPSARERREPVRDGDASPVASEQAALSSSACPNPAWCINVTRQKLEAALAATQRWEAQEKQRAYYTSTGLSPLPLVATILKMRKGAAIPAGVHGSSWGKAGILFTIRRAAFFTQQLFPELKTITVLRVDTSHPPPSASSFDAHTNGVCADIGYLLTGDGNDTHATLDVERTFWFAYAVRNTPGFFQMLTDYKDELMSYRDLAVERGVIRPDSFTSGDLMADSSMNHDTHLHVGVQQ